MLKVILWLLACLFLMDRIDSVTFHIIFQSYFLFHGFESMCDNNTHTHTHTHTLSLSHSLSLSHFFSFHFSPPLQIQLDTGSSTFGVASTHCNECNVTYKYSGAYESSNAFDIDYGMGEAQFAPTVGAISVCGDVFVGVVFGLIECEERERVRERECVCVCVCVRCLLCVWG